MIHCDPAPFVLLSIATGVKAFVRPGTNIDQSWDRGNALETKSGSSALAIYGLSCHFWLTSSDFS